MLTLNETILLLSLVAFVASAIALHIHFLKELKLVRAATIAERRARIEMGKKCLHLVQIIYNDAKSNKRQTHMLMESFADHIAEQETDDVSEDRNIEATGSPIQ